MCVVTGGTDIEWLLKGEYGKTCYSWAIWKKKKIVVLIIVEWNEFFEKTKSVW